MSTMSVCDVCQDEPRLDGKPVCFTCHFWQEKVLLHRADPDHWFVADGVSYHIGNEHTSSVRGFAGARAVIEWPHSGDRVVTTNLWCQGRVPERFRGLLPDRAVLRWV